jgi:uracil phosphoribosyltransferase
MIVDRTEDVVMRLLVDATRRSDVVGPRLADAHREVGRHLAASLAPLIHLEPYDLHHVAGASTGVRVQEGREPVIVALLRAGLFVAEGIWSMLPQATFVPLDHGRKQLLGARLEGRPVVVVDAVVNTGASVLATLEAIQPLQPGHVAVATLVAWRPRFEQLAKDHADVTWIAARLSDRSYVGRGGTDTGARLFGTTAWES